MKYTKITILIVGNEKVYNWRRHPMPSLLAGKRMMSYGSNNDESTWYCSTYCPVLSMHITCASSASKLCNLTFYHSETMDLCNVRILDYDIKITSRKYVKQFAFHLSVTSMSSGVNLPQNYWHWTLTFKVLGRRQIIYGIRICTLAKAH